MEQTVQIEEVLQYGWAQTKKHFGYLVGLIIILFLASALLNYVGTIPVLGALLAIAGQVVLNIGTLRLTLALSHGQKLSYKELFTTVKPFWPFLGASFLVMLLVGVGFALLIVPGVILGLTLQFYSYLIVDKGMGVVDSLKESARITKGKRLQLFWLMVVLAIINIVGALLFGIGLFVSIPLTMMAMVHVYQQLIGNTPEVAEEGPAEPESLEVKRPAI